MSKLTKYVFLILSQIFEEMYLLDISIAETGNKFVSKEEKQMNSFPAIISNFLNSRNDVTLDYSK